MNQYFHKEALKIKLDERSKFLRKLVIKCIEAGGRGHIGAAMSLIEILRVLYDNFLVFDPKNVNLKSRDRFILSKGHGCLALYAVLADKNFFSKNELSVACEPKSILGGHPEIKVPGVEASTGALGHGLPIGVGMALAAKLKKENHKVVVVIGDGESNEGSIWESAMSAAKHNLSNLIVLLDHNKIQSYSFVSEVLNLEPLNKKWESFGFNVTEINGHDIQQIKEALTQNIDKKDKPKLIVCHTIKGKGIAVAENNPKWHHKNNLSKKDIEDLYNSLN